MATLTIAHDPITVTPAPGIKHTASYIRVSSDAQARDGSSLPEQRAANRAKIGAGYRIGEYHDDESGTSFDRDGMNALHEAIRRGDVERVVATKVDRLGRNTYEQAAFIHYLNTHDVPYEFSKQDVDTKTAEGRLLMQLLAAIAEYESHTIGRRSIDVRRWRAKQGLYPRRAPYGYRRTADGHLDIVPEEAAIVVEVFTRFAEKLPTGEWAITKLGLAQELNERGVPCPGAIPGRGHRTKTAAMVWERATLHQIFFRDEYVGHVRLHRMKSVRRAERGPRGGKYKTVKHPDAYTIGVDTPAIVPVALRDAVHARLKINAERKTAGGRPPAAVTIFRKFLRCECGARLRPYCPKGRAWTLRCTSRETGAGACGLRSHALVPAEATLYDAIAGFFAEPDRLLVAVRKNLSTTYAGREAEADKARAAIAKERPKRDRILDMFADGLFDKAERDNRLRAVDARLTAARNLLAEAEANMVTFDAKDEAAAMRQAARRLATASTEERAALMGDVVKAITVGEHAATVEVWVGARFSDKLGTTTRRRSEFATKAGVGRSDIEADAKPQPARRFAVAALTVTLPTAADNAGRFSTGNQTWRRRATARP